MSPILLQNDKLCLYLSKRILKPFADQFFDRVPTEEELFSDLKFPLIVDFKSGSLAYYYDNEGVICFDYYEMWKPKEE